jgi:hypothetical protein
LSLDPRFVEIRHQDLAIGQHRNTTDRIDYFTTSYFHVQLTYAADARWSR